MDTSGHTLDDPSFLGTLRDLHRKADFPSTRQIAERSAGAVSHAAVHDTLRGKSYPRWPHAAAIITALGGDPAAYRDLWSRWRPAGSVELAERPANSTAELITALTVNTAALDRLTAAVKGLYVPRAGDPPPPLWHGPPPPGLVRS